MAVAPKAAFGTLLKIGDGTTVEGFNTLVGVRNLGGPEFSLEMIDTTHHSSASAYREMVASFISAGTVNFDLLFDSADNYHLQLFTDFEARTLRNWELVFTDTGTQTHSFSAYISSMALAAPIDDAVTMACTITISGAVTRS
jgi:predicted secreted protein